MNAWYWKHPTESLDIPLKSLTVTQLLHIKLGHKKKRQNQLNDKN